ncbi:MAG: GNAT family N-acetyltransferase [Vulcanimicrobiaceae bacterium]
MIRSYRHEDAQALRAVANDPDVARYMTDRFPSPYTLADARAWISQAMDIDLEESNFAIDCRGEFAGGIGFARGAFEHRFSAEFGYWLGKRFWGNGIATAAVRALLDWIWQNTDLERLQAHVFSPNVASARVLEKAGLHLESIKRRDVFKGGAFYDAWLYVALKNVPGSHPSE